MPLTSGGCHPCGNAKARAVVWNFPDGVPQHREPLYSPRPDLVAKYPTHDDKKTERMHPSSLGFEMAQSTDL